MDLEPLPGACREPGSCATGPIIAVLPGCALRRCEVAALTDGRSGAHSRRRRQSPHGRRSRRWHLAQVLIPTEVRAWGRHASLAVLGRILPESPRTQFPG